MRAKDAVGRYGENVAATHLRAAGMQLLDRNWRGTGGELDIVADEAGVLVVVEVKTRRSARYGHPAEAVTRVKQARLRRLTGEWLATHEFRAASIRIDVVAVLVQPHGAARVEHLRGVL